MIFLGVFGLICWIIIFDYFSETFLVFLVTLIIGSVFPVLRKLVIKLIKLFSKPISLVHTYYENVISTKLLKIDKDYINLEQWLSNSSDSCIEKIKIPKSDIISVELKSMMSSTFSDILIIYFSKKYDNDEYENKCVRFGAFLTQQEKEWLVWEIKNTLN